MNQPSHPSNLKDLYDDTYACRLLAREESRRIRPILAHVTLPVGAKILDVGCGNGPLAGLLAQRIGEYHGVDFSEAFVKQARRLADEQGLVNCQFHVGDVVDFIDQHPGQFDAVFALDISEHVPDAEWAPIVAAFERALKPGGQVIAHTPNLDFFIERMKERGIFLKQFPEHVAVRTAVQNMVFLEYAGLSSVQVRYLPHYNVLRALHPLSKIPGIGRFFAARLLLTATRE
ncbi:MAG: class I SAM-dependent methyltransferase [Xanthomonadales bacterium]|nr:class I SAM-dependent methyltransferase [Xanthomonadales bacterium]